MLLKLLAQKELKQQQALAAADAWERFERQMERAGSYVPFQDELGRAGYKRKLSNKHLIWDCASTHGAVRISSFRKKSFWHSYALRAGMKGVIFLPPRTPTLNPIELAFGFVKHHVRKQCPDEGYTPVGLLQAIHSAFRLITPQMIKNRVKKAGYRFTSAKEEGRLADGDQDAAADADQPTCMDIDDDESLRKKLKRLLYHLRKQMQVRHTVIKTTLYQIVTLNQELYSIENGQLCVWTSMELLSERSRDETPHLIAL